MATISNLFVDQGSDFSVNVNLRNQDGTPMILTGYTIVSRFQKSSTSTNSWSFDTSIVNASTGKINLSLLGSNSMLIRPGRYLYDVIAKVSSDGSNPKRVLEGIVTITQAITPVS